MGRHAPLARPSGRRAWAAPAIVAMLSNPADPGRTQGLNSGRGRRRGFRACDGRWPELSAALRDSRS